MGRFLRYLAGGLFLAYAMHGGCDRNIEDVFKEKYAKPMIAARETVSDFVLENGKELYNKLEENLESKIIKGGVR